MMLALAENEILNTFLKSLSTILDSIFKIIGALDDYKGSEFCSGLLFGITGSNLILNMGKDVMTQMENIESFEKVSKAKMAQKKKQKK